MILGSVREGAVAESDYPIVWVYHIFLLIRAAWRLRPLSNFPVAGREISGPALFYRPTFFHRLFLYPPVTTQPTQPKFSLITWSMS